MHINLWQCNHKTKLKQKNYSYFIFLIQVIFEGSKAVGVEYVKDGKNHTVKANKEIILSAGAIGSAQILLLSGVGPRKHLHELNVRYNWLSSWCRN